MESKVAVIGANGFLGKIVTEYLRARGYNVLPITRSDIVLTDYTSVREWLKKETPNVIVNCAIAGSKTKHNDVVYSDLQSNISSFLSFFNNSKLFDRYINIGSGAEFDNSNSIISAIEDQIFVSNPTSTYGYSKNIISRLCSTSDKFYTLRLFGCFDPSEAPFRFFKTMLTSKSISIQDRYFDMFSAKDLCSVIDYVITNDCNYRDINCTYRKKYTLVALANMFRDYHGLEIDINIQSGMGNSYTGDYKRLYSTGVPLIGLIQSMKDYK